MLTPSQRVESFSLILESAPELLGALLRRRGFRADVKGANVMCTRNGRVFSGRIDDPEGLAQVDRVADILARLARANASTLHEPIVGEGFDFREIIKTPQGDARAASQWAENIRKELDAVRGYTWAVGGNPKPSAPRGFTIRAMRRMPSPPTFVDIEPDVDDSVATVVESILDSIGPKP